MNMESICLGYVTMKLLFHGLETTNLFVIGIIITRHSAKDNSWDTENKRNRFMYLEPKIWNSIPIAIKNKTFIQFQKLCYNHLLKIMLGAFNICLKNWPKTNSVCMCWLAFEVGNDEWLSDLTALSFTICFCLYLNDDIRSRFYVHCNLLDIRLVFSLSYLLILVYWNEWAMCAVFRLACVETLTAFPNTIWNGLLAVKGFPKYIYVKTVDTLMHVFAMSRFCCVVTRLAVSCCCRFS